MFAFRPSNPDIIERLMGLFDSEGQFNYSVHVSEKLGFVYFNQPVAGCTSVKLNLNAWEAEARGLPFGNRTSAEIHKRDLNPLLKPREVGYRRFAEMLRSRNVAKVTSWRHPRDRAISAYLKKLARRSEQGRRFAAAFPVEGPLSFDLFVRLLAENEQALLFDPHWRPQTLNAAVGLLEMDRVLLLETLDADLGELSLLLLGRRADIRDARAASPWSASGRETKPELAAMTASYERHASRLYEGDLAYYQGVLKSRGVAPAPTPP